MDSHWTKIIPLNHSFWPTGSMWQCLYLQRSFLCLYCVIILLVLGDFWASPILSRDDCYGCYFQVIKYRRFQLVARQLAAAVFIDLGNEIQLVTCLRIQTTDRSLYAVNSICRDLHKTKLMITGWFITFHSRLFPFVLPFHFIPIQRYWGRSIELLHKRC